MSIYLKNFLRFCLLVLLQVAVLNKVHLRWWAEPLGFPVFVPMIYPLAFLLLPFNTPKWLLYILAFIGGLIVDLFSNTAALHALSLLCMVGLRSVIMALLLPKNLEEYGSQTPSEKNMTWLPFLTYAAILLLVHHLVFFSLELWSLKNIIYLLIKTFASLLTSILLVVIYTLLFGKQVAVRRGFHK